MDPISYVLSAESGFALGNLVFMVGKDIVHTAGVDVELLTQILFCHRGTFDVPAGGTLRPKDCPTSNPGPVRLPSTG